MKVFISSTSTDLEAYTNAARDVVVNLGWQPVMMGNFGTDGYASIAKACARKVRECDVVLAIVAWRRGTLVEPEPGSQEQISYTALEVETAKKEGKPLLVFLADDWWPHGQCEHEAEAIAWVAAFRRKLDRLAVFFAWEEVRAGKEPLPVFQAKVLRELLRHREGGRLHTRDTLGDRFELRELLGESGCASVWKAWDGQRNGLVAVKVLQSQYAVDLIRRERFARAAREMAVLRHSGIVQVIEAEMEDRGYHFFVMEYLPGGDLRRAVLEGRLGTKALALVRQVGEALQYAHERDVLHRAVKPSNVLLDKAGNPKLTDFGLVRTLDTTGSTRMGAPWTFFTAPEAMDEPDEAGPLADLYSLAMMAVFCLYGKDLPAKDALRERKKDFIQRLPCPPAVRWVLERALSWEPGKRHGSVVELLAALDVAAARQPTMKGMRWPVAPDGEEPSP